MVKQSVNNSNKEFILNRNIFHETIPHPKKLNQALESNSKSSYHKSVAPVLKYHTNSFSSNSTGFGFSKESEKRFVNQVSTIQPDQAVKFDSTFFKNISSVPVVNSLSVDKEIDFSKDLCNSFVVNQKPANFDSSSSLLVPVAVSTSYIPTVGSTGSLITPAKSKAIDQNNSMISGHSETFQRNIKNQSKNSFNAKTLPLSQPSHFPINNLSMFRVQQQNLLSSTILPQYERPSSAKQGSAVYNSKGVNTAKSYLSKSDALLKTVLPGASCSSIRNGTHSLLRPKSSFRQRLMNSHAIARPNNDNDSKHSSQSIKSLCIVNQSSSSESVVNSAPNVAPAKKLKPVNQEQFKTKSILSKDRVKGLSKLNLAMNSSSVYNGNTYGTVNDQSNSNSSICDSSGISSSCSLFSESKSDSACQSVSKCGNESNKLNYNKSDESKPVNIYAATKPKKVRPLTGTKKVKKKITNFTDPKKKLVDSTIDSFQKVTLSNSISATSLDSSLKYTKSSIATEKILVGSISSQLPSNKVEFYDNQGKEESLTNDFNYEDSSVDGNGIEDEEDCTNELVEDVESFRGSDIAIGEFICDDNDVLDCIDDSTVCSLDDDYVGSECTESESSGVETYCLSHKSNGQDENKKPAVIKSLFSNCPAVINFATQFEQIDSLPVSVRKLLKWKMSTITPIVVRNTVMRSGFKPSKKSHDWIGYFGKHMKSNGFRSLREYQKINHFPGSFQLGRKDRLWRNMSRMQTRYGKKEFGFVPRSYVLPWDKKLLKNAWEEGGTKQKYILKPPASARGIGIKVIHKWNQIPTRKPIMVQKYLSRPYLINGNKFDLRLYVHVTSFDPLRIYLFDDGLVRFATCKYSSSMKHLSNKYMHLTNYSINKKSGNFEQNDNASICQGHKWSLKALWGYMQQRGVNTDKIWEQMKEIVIKTIISVEQFTNSLVKSNCRRRYCCHELFGFDIMLDDKLRAWLLEVNISPSLHSNSPLDVQIKGAMVKDMFNLCGFHLPDKKQIGSNAPTSLSGSSIPSASASFSQDKRKQGAEVTSDSRAKHSYFAQHYKLMDEQAMTSFLLDTLTVNDIRILVEGEVEAERRGNFQKIFPCLNRKYLSFFEQPRYYNELLYAWEVRYSRQSSKGHELLESCCLKGLHLHQVVSDPTNIPQENVWSPNFINHPKIAPPPRTDSKITLSHSKHINGFHPTVHPPTSVSTLTLTNGWVDDVSYAMWEDFVELCSDPVICEKIAEVILNNSRIDFRRSKSAKPGKSRSEDGATAGVMISSKPISSLHVINAST